MNITRRPRTQTKREFLRVPISLLAPAWMVVCTIGGMWYTNSNANADRDQKIVAIQKDIGYMNRTLAKLDKKLDDSNANNVTRVEMMRELATIKAQTQGHNNK